MTMISPWSAEERELAHAITAAGRPYLYLASRLLADPIKRTAFEVAYASMRLADDAVDRGDSPEASLHRSLKIWQQRMRAAHEGRPARPDDLLGTAMTRLFQLFELP